MPHFIANGVTLTNFAIYNYKCQIQSSSSIEFDFWLLRRLKYFWCLNKINALAGGVALFRDFTECSKSRTKVEETKKVDQVLEPIESSAVLSFYPLQEMLGFSVQKKNVGLFGICTFAINRPKKISLPIINSLLSKAHHFLSSLVSAKSGKSALNHDDCAFCAPRAAGLLHKSFVNYVTKIRSNKGTKLCLVHTINFYFAITIFSLAHII